MSTRGAPADLCIGGLAWRHFARVVPFLMVLTLACSEAQGPPPQRVMPVKAGPVVTKSVPIEVRAIGHVEPISSVGIRAQVGGELIRLGFTEGQDVVKGTTLFSIDPRPFSIALAQAQANLARDQAQLQNAEAQLTRYGDLAKKDFVTDEQYAQLRTNAEVLKAQIKADEAAIDNTKLQLERATIRAPMDGRTGALGVHVGDIIRANDATPMVVINQTRPVYVSFKLPQSNLPDVVKNHDTEKLKVTTTLVRGVDETRQGELTFVDNEVDEATGTIALKATFLNEDGALWPGAFTDVRLVLGEQQDAVVAPSEAVQTGQNGTYVFVIKEDSTVESVPVVVARTVGPDAVIASGLSAGQAVVTDGLLRLTNGTKVVVQKALESRP